MESFVGKMLGKYEIRRELSRGAVTAVYLAYQPQIEREVVLKVLPSGSQADATFLARFKQEVKTIARLQHPHILSAFDYGEDHGYTYLVTPYHRGGSLADRLAEAGGGLPLDEVVRITGQVAAALNYAHEQGVTHSNLKPSNVLLDRSGNAYLADFSLPLIVETTARLTGSTLFGAPHYLAPEATEGGTAASDIYALGAMLYEMVTGRVPYSGKSPIEVLRAHRYEPVPDARALRPDLPDAVQSVIETAMAKDPAARFPRAGELVAALRAAVAGLSPEVEAEPEPEPAPQPLPAADLPGERVKTVQLGPDAIAPAAFPPEGRLPETPPDGDVTLQPSTPRDATPQAAATLVASAPPRLPAEPAPTLAHRAAAEVAPAPARPVDVPAPPAAHRPAKRQRGPLWGWIVAALVIVGCLLVVAVVVLAFGLGWLGG